MQLGSLNWRPSQLPRAASAARRGGATRSLPRGASGVPRQQQRCRAAPEADGAEEACFVTQIDIDNTSFPSYTKLHLEAPEYPGLLRVVSWVLNGMLLRVENAVLKLDNAGFAIHDYWIRDVFGKKLSDNSAELLADRLGDFIAACKPSQQQLECKEFAKDNISISNVAHEQYTQVVIAGEPGGKKPGFLLELASVITGAGLVIHEAVVQGAADSGVAAPAVQPPLGYNPQQGRLFIFYVTNTKDRSKLDYADTLALTFTLQLVLGKSSAQLVAPNLDLVAH